jgi:Tol biopolymer transport system component
VPASRPGSADPACFSSDALAVSWGCWSSAVLSPTGRYVALHSGASSITSVLTLDGREVAQIFDGQDGRARWSPVEDVLAISGGAELDIVDASGGTTSRIPVPAQIKGVQSWSSDGRRVVIKAMDVPELWAVDIASGASVRLTDTPTVDEQESAWAPDGSRVAYTADCGEAWTPDGPCPSSLWTVESDGTDARRLTPEGGDMVAWPIWAPDGSHLAYTRSALPGDGGGNVYVIDADGSIPRQVTTFERGFAGVLGWSPDGSTIVVAYVRQNPKTHEVDVAETWIMGADGSNPRLLVQGTSDVDEVWAPTP